MAKNEKAPPVVFISYSWDDDDHKAWVRAIAERLRGDGVEAMLDQWVTAPGDQLPAFMESSVRGSDFVVSVCTPRYKERSEKRVGGVGYEGDIITAELMRDGNRRKFIPVLRRGDDRSSIPSWLSGCYYIDLRDGGRFEEQYLDLLNTVWGTRPKPPPLGPAPTVDRKKAPVNSRPSLVSEQVRILGVIVDEVSEPRLDGTRGSALYEVPFRLSRVVSADWARAFEEMWNHPPRYTTMHRPGIATVSGDRLVLDGTTMEEVHDYHRDTLVLCVRETNALIEKQLADIERERQARAEALDQHRRTVRDVSNELDFDD